MDQEYRWDFGCVRYWHEAFMWLILHKNVLRTQECSHLIKNAHRYLHHFCNKRNSNIILLQSKIVVEAHRSADGAELIYLRLHLPHNLPCSFTTPIFKVRLYIITSQLDDDRMRLSNDRKSMYQKVSALVFYSYFVKSPYLTSKYHTTSFYVWYSYYIQVSYQIVLEFYLDGDEESSQTKIDANSKNENSKFHANDGKKSFRKTLEPFTWNLPIDINIRKYPLDTVSEINSCFDPVSEIVLNFPWKDIYPIISVLRFFTNFF